MHTLRLRHFLVLLLLPLLTFAAEEKKTAPSAAPTTSAPRPKQYVYVLKLTPRLHDDSAWTDEDKKTVGAHFAHLKEATAAGKVILAGRTLEPGSKTFGLVIFEAEDEPAATKFMNSDPAVIAQVMSVQLHPYQVVLQRNAK